MNDAKIEAFNTFQNVESSSTVKYCGSLGDFKISFGFARKKEKKIVLPEHLEADLWER